MFEKSLADTLKKIFDLSKVEYALPSESQEHDCIFISIQSAKSNVRDGKFVSKVTGKITVFCNFDRLPYGYFQKKIAAADKSLTENLFFYDIEENSGLPGRVAERTMSFIYLFNSSYNPAQDISAVTIAQINVGT